MKIILGILFCMSAFAAAPSPSPAPVAKEAAAPKLKTTSPYCWEFDAKQGFIRCESVEIICYRFGKFEQCYPKPPKAPEKVVEKK